MKHLLPLTSQRLESTKQTALPPKRHLGWATVTHPFHPLLGKRFEVLKVRKVRGKEILSLFDEHNGSITLPREWTDQAPPSPYLGLVAHAPVLDVGCLIELRELIQGC